MKIKKLIAGLAASALAASCLGISAFADDSWDAWLMFTSSDWSWSDMGDSGKVAQDQLPGTHATIDKDGDYTVSISAEDLELDYGAPDALGVFCVDIDVKGDGSLEATKHGMAHDLGGGATNDGEDDNGYADCETNADKKQFFIDKTGVTITNVKLLFDDKEVYTYADDEINYGDIEGNGKLRIELYNMYGNTASSSSAELVDLLTNSTDIQKVAVSFTVTGLSGGTTADPEPEAPADPEPEAPAEPEAPSGTGLAGIALVGLALSGASVVATKKRK